MKNIRPIGLKGNDKLDRMRSLMGKKAINENTSNSKVELTKLAPDNKVYGIVRENQEYFIKTSTKINNLTLEDFNYIGGLANKKAFAFESYAKALKKLNLKMISLNEQLEGDNVNVFRNDNLYNEEVDVEQEIEDTLINNTFIEEEIGDKCKCGLHTPDACNGEGHGCDDDDSLDEGELKVKAINDGPKELDGNTIGDYEDVTDGPEKAPNDKSTGTEKEGAETATPKKTVKEGKKCKFSILKAMERMDSIIESMGTKKKSLNEKKYKLKIDDPSPAEPQIPGDESFNDFPEEPSGESMPEPELGMDEPTPDSGGAEKPFDDTPFDAGVEADEDADPKKFIEQLSGKLGTSLRTYTKDVGIDYDLEKFAVNSVISATHTGDMEEEDQEDIIGKVRSAGKGDEESEGGEDELGMTGASEPETAPPSAPSDGGGAEGGLGENFQVLPKEHKQVFKNAKLGVTEGFGFKNDNEEFERSLDVVSDLAEKYYDTNYELAMEIGGYVEWCRSKAQTPDTEQINQIFARHGVESPMVEAIGILPKEHKQVFKNAKLGVTEHEEEISFSGGKVADYMDIQDFERVDREVEYGIDGHDYLDEDEEVGGVEELERQIATDFQGLGDEILDNQIDTDFEGFGEEMVDEDEEVINPKDSLGDSRKNSNFGEEIDDRAIKQMIDRYLTTKDGFTQESEEPATKPVTKPEPTKIPRRRKPFRVQPGVNPNPKAIN